MGKRYTFDKPEATILPGQEWREMFGAYERALRTIAHGGSEGVKLRILAELTAAGSGGTSNHPGQSTRMTLDALHLDLLRR